MNSQYNISINNDINKLFRYNSNKFQLDWNNIRLKAKKCNINRLTNQICDSSNTAIALYS